MNVREFTRMLYCTGSTYVICCEDPKEYCRISYSIQYCMLLFWISVYSTKLRDSFIWRVDNPSVNTVMKIQSIGEHQDLLGIGSSSFGSLVPQVFWKFLYSTKEYCNLVEARIWRGRLQIVTPILLRPCLEYNTYNRFAAHSIQYEGDGRMGDDDVLELLLSRMISIVVLQLM